MNQCSVCHKFFPFQLTNDICPDCTRRMAPRLGPLGLKSAEGSLEAVDLLQCIDEALARLPQDSATLPRRTATQGSLPVYTIESPTDWLGLARDGALTVLSTKRDLMPCYLEVGHASQRRRIQVTKKPGKVHSERCLFIVTSGRPDLSYPEIADAFDRLFPAPMHPQVARDILAVACGLQVNGYTSEQLDFLAGMAVLLFGVEASRLMSALVSGVLILDLIAQQKHYGRGRKAFTFRAAFASDLTWDRHYSHAKERQPALYGGKYPQAVYEHGGGNMAARRQMTDTSHRNYSPMWNDHVVLLRDRHSVPRREAALFIHWLLASVGREVTQLNRGDVRDLLVIRLSDVFLRGEVDTELVHDSADFPSSGRDYSSVLPGTFFYYKLGFFFHFNPLCKLIPSQFRPTKGTRSGLSGVEMLDWEEGTYRQSLIIRDDHEQVLSKLRSGTVSEMIELMDKQGLKPCEHCCPWLGEDLGDSLTKILDRIERASDDPYELRWIVGQLSTDQLADVVHALRFRFMPTDSNAHIFWRALDALIQLTNGNEEALRDIIGALTLEQAEQLCKSYEDDLALMLGYEGRVDERIQREVISLIESTHFI